MTIRDLVGGSVVSTAPDSTIRKAAGEMKEMEVGSLAVIVDGDLEGIITERDILRAAADFADFDREKVRSWMTSLPDTFGPDMEIYDAADWMLATGYRHLPVIEDSGELLGMVSIKDILWALAGKD